MDKIKYLKSEFNLCNQLTYDETPINVSQQEVDNLIEDNKILNINKIKVGKETTLLAVGNLSSINKFPFIKR